MQIQEIPQGFSHCAQSTNLHQDSMECSFKMQPPGTQNHIMGWGVGWAGVCTLTSPSSHPQRFLGTLKLETSLEETMLVTFPNLKGKYCTYVMKSLCTYDNCSRHHASVSFTLLTQEVCLGCLPQVASAALGTKHTDKEIPPQSPASCGSG